MAETVSLVAPLYLEGPRVFQKIMFGPQWFQATCCPWPATNWTDAFPGTTLDTREELCFAGAVRK